MIMGKEIMIGGVLTRVPKGYIQAEAAYTEYETIKFRGAVDSSEREKYRSKVLAKRVEFHQLYLSGKAKVTPPQPVVKKSTFSRVCNWLRGAEW